MWDERFSIDGYFYGTEPNTFLRESVAHLRPGSVLCLAEGEGRNAVYLAQQGFTVTAVDSSRVGREKAMKLAQSAGVTITYEVVDLAEYSLMQDAWDNIVSIFCHLPPTLRQRVHAAIPDALKPNGCLIIEGYSKEQLQRDTGGPKDSAMLFSVPELTHEIAGLNWQRLQHCQRDVIEGIGHTGEADVVQGIGVK